MASHAHDKTTPHPLDPLGLEEVRTASQTVFKHNGYYNDEIRFKLIDLAEPPKAETLQHLRHNGPTPDRKARVYYHEKKSQSLMTAIVNLTKKTVVSTAEAPQSQGPVDWYEYDLITKACNSHPLVQAEIAKLKLPPK